MQLLGVIVEERGSLYIVTEYMAKVCHRFSIVSSHWTLSGFKVCEQYWEYAHILFCLFNPHKNQSHVTGDYLLGNFWARSKVVAWQLLPDKKWCDTQHNKRI